jgi:hypothetical protein
METDRLLEILDEIGYEEYKPVEECGLYGAEFKPAVEDWLMIYVYVRKLDSWMVEKRADGYHWVIDPTMYPWDVLVQVYANGWIIRHRPRSRLIAAYRPDVVEKIKEAETMVFEELGIKVPIPENFKAWVVSKKDGCGDYFDSITFHKNLDQWEQYASYNVDYNHHDWLQRIARKNIDDYVVLAMSSDFLAGVDSYGFTGYFIMKRSEFEQIETTLQHLIWQKYNGIHEAIVWMLRQNFKGDKAYLNFFNGIERNECEDDGMMRYITPKRTIPKDLFGKLPMKKFDWGSYEYSKREGREWMIVLQSEFEPSDKFEERLKAVNETIAAFMGVA